jgi:hypothetical protein
MRCLCGKRLGVRRTPRGPKVSCARCGIAFTARSDTGYAYLKQLLSNEVWFRVARQGGGRAVRDISCAHEIMRCLCGRMPILEDRWLSCVDERCGFCLRTGAYMLLVYLAVLHRDTGEKGYISKRRVYCCDRLCAFWIHGSKLVRRCTICKTLRTINAPSADAGEH